MSSSMRVGSDTRRGRADCRARGSESGRPALCCLPISPLGAFSSRAGHDELCPAHRGHRCQRQTSSRARFVLPANSTAAGEPAIGSRGSTKTTVQSALLRRTVRTELPTLGTATSARPPSAAVRSRMRCRTEVCGGARLARGPRPDSRAQQALRACILCHADPGV